MIAKDINPAFLTRAEINSPVLKKDPRERLPTISSQITEVSLRESRL
jgi:hypothetical protein